jgi:SOS-response transcriptional repressor LexA
MLNIHLVKLPDMSRSERISRAISESGRTKKEIADLCGVSPGAVTQWTTGETKSIRPENLVALSRATGKAIEWLATGEGPVSESHGNVAEDGAPTYRSGERVAPVISWVQAGDWCEASDPYPAGYSDEWERVPDQAGKHAFWLRVVGDSMTAPSGLSIPEGMLILVDPDYLAVSGRLVVAKLTDSQHVTFKRLIEDSGRRYLKPLNPAYPMIEVNGNCRIIGAVREAKVKL